MSLSWGCYNEAPQTGGLTIAAIYSLTVLVARRPCQGVGRAVLLLEATGEGASCLLQLLGLQPSGPVAGPPGSASVFTRPSSCLSPSHCRDDPGASPQSESLIPSAKILCPNKVTFPSFGD